MHAVVRFVAESALHLKAVIEIKPERVMRNPHYAGYMSLSDLTIISVGVCERLVLKL